MTRKLIDSADALNIIMALLRYLSKPTEWNEWISWAKRRIDELPETENAIISDISNIVVGTIENDSDDDATKINKIKEVLIDYYRETDDEH